MSLRTQDFFSSFKLRQRPEQKGDTGMSALALRRFYGGVQRQANALRRCQSTDSTVQPAPPFANAGTTRTATPPFRRTPVERPAHTHCESCLTSYC